MGVYLKPRWYNKVPTENDICVSDYNASTHMEEIKAYISNGGGDDIIPHAYLKTPENAPPFMYPHAWRILRDTFKCRISYIDAICDPKLKIDKKTATSLMSVGVVREGYGYLLSNMEYIIRQLFKLSAFKPKPNNKYAESKALLAQLGMISGPNGLYRSNQWHTNYLWLPPKSMINIVQHSTGLIINHDAHPLILTILYGMAKGQNQKDVEGYIYKTTSSYAEYFDQLSKHHFQGKTKGSGGNGKYWRSGVTTTRVSFSGRAILGAITSHLPPITCIAPWSVAVPIFKIPIIKALIDDYGLTPYEATTVHYELINDADRMGIAFKEWFINYVNYSNIHYPSIFDEFKQCPTGHACSLIRYPSLSIKSIYQLNMLLDPTDTVSRTIRLYPGIVTPFNGDFDGDEVSIKIMLSVQEMEDMRGFRIHRHMGSHTIPYDQSGIPLTKAAVAAANALLAEED